MSRIPETPIDPEGVYEGNPEHNRIKSISAIMKDLQSYQHNVQR